MVTDPKKEPLEAPLEALSPPERPPGAWGWTEGRPSSYPHHRLKALQLAEQGATLEELSAELRLTIRTLSRWRHSHRDFSDALDRGRAKRTMGQDARSLGRKAAAEAERAAALQRDRAEHAAREARIAEGAMALQAMLKHMAPLPPTAAPASALQPAAAIRTPAAPAAEPGNPRSRVSEYRRRFDPAAGNPEVLDGDCEALPMEDPLAGW
jgi:hypothetical protein